MVASSTWRGLCEPDCLVSMSCTPAASRMGRTAPPAMTPVPGTAGFRKTRPAPKCPVISQGMVVSFSGTKIRSFLACSTALRIASGTSWALPRPTPTWPRPSPTTTSAVNENRRPPLTPLATRLMETTRSFSSARLDRSSLQPLDSPDSLEDQAAGPGRIGERLHASVVHVAAPVEHDALDALRLGLLGQELAHELGRCDVAPRRLPSPECLAPAVDGQQGAPGVVVHQLRVDVIEAPEHGQPRPRARAAHEPAKPAMPDVPRYPPLLRDHLAPAPAFLPTFRRTTSLAYLMPLPLYGSGSRSARSFAAVCPRMALSAPRSVMDT